MLLEYAVEPTSIASDWQTFRYLIEKFGFERGRLISQFPNSWLRQVYEASSGFKTMERKKLEVRLAASSRIVVRSRREFDPGAGWLQNAVAQQGRNPFHAIIAADNPDEHASVLVPDDASDDHPLMLTSTTWEVPRTGGALAGTMSPFLRSARSVLFVDRFFDLSKDRYRQTLAACLASIREGGNRCNRVEIHCCDEDTVRTVQMLERNALVWFPAVIPDGMTVAVHFWRERDGGEDFHARYLLTDIGGVSVDAGFSAEGAHQNVQIALLDFEFSERKRNLLSTDPTIYDRLKPTLEIFGDGTTKRV